MFAGKLLVVAVSETVAFKALAFFSIVPFDSHRGREGNAVIWSILVIAPDTRAGQGDLISFVVSLCHANGTASLNRAKRTARPFEGLHRHPLFSAARLAPCITRRNAQSLRR